MSAARSGIVDAWIQHPTTRFLAQPMFASLRRWTGRDEVPDVPLSATIAAMDQAGVGTALVSAWWGPQGALIDNDEVAALVREHPDRLVGIASADITRPMEGVRELRRAVRELGFRGLRFLPWMWGLPPDDRRYYPFYAECVELGIPFCLQVGHTGPLLPSEPGRPIPYLEHVALEFPELVIVAGHIGAPWTQEIISLATKFPNVYIDTSAYKANRYPADFVEFLRGRGAKKVLFGSNYPMLTPGQCLEDFDALGLDAEAEERFLRGNARKVFGLGDVDPSG
ncbi:amidohydrolase family protein [Lentisalinibacter salinarum]|uniref:amidohydrolase family protein n=1 Tax=Lentisalinibacter salinarum TaxID=2992239 RepID=UPI0038689DD5